MGFFNKGASDKSQNKGQEDPNKFKNHTDREKYQAGYNAQKEKEQQQKKK